MSLRDFTVEHSTWQKQRRWVSHQVLGNEISNILLDAETADAIDEIMTASEWQEKLSRWNDRFVEVGVLALRGAYALSPARFLEHFSWSSLSADARRSAGQLLEEDWWLSVCMAERIDRVAEHVNAALRQCSAACDALNNSGAASHQFREQLHELRGIVALLREGLKMLDLSITWKPSASS